MKYWLILIFVMMLEVVLFQELLLEVEVQQAVMRNVLFGGLLLVVDGIIER